MAPENESAWQRLGSLLEGRRTEIAARYENKNLFAKERGINRRMLWSVETGARDTYTPETLQDIERSYMLAPGSIRRTLEGGGLEPLDEAPPARRNPFAGIADPHDEPEGDDAWTVFPDPADFTLRWIWRMPVEEKVRTALVADHRARQRAAREGIGQSSAGLAPPDGNDTVTNA